MNRRDAIKAAAAVVAAAALPEVDKVTATIGGHTFELPRCRGLKAARSWDKPNTWLVEATFEGGTDLRFNIEGSLFENVLYRHLWDETAYSTVFYKAT